MSLTSWLANTTNKTNKSTQPRRRRSECHAAVAAIVETLEVKKLLSAAPVITSLGPNLTYTEGAPPTPVAAHAMITDASSAFANSTLTITTTNGVMSDQLGVLPANGVGVGPHGAVLFASSPTATPVQIGSVTGGTGNTPLVIKFNQSATASSVQAVLDQVGYGIGTSTLPIPDRHVSIVFTDGNKVSSVPVVQDIHVNPAPVIGGLSPNPVNYAVNTHPVALAPSAVISDAAGAYANSKLSVQLSGGDASDQLRIQANGALTLGPNNSLVFNGITVGTFSGGNGTMALVITFNSKATHDSVQAVLDNITFAYATTSHTSNLNNRLATTSFVDGNNVASALEMEGIHVTN